MAKYDDGRIREYDKDGKLIAAGFVWNEDSHWVERFTKWALPVPFIAMMLAPIGMSTGNKIAGPMLMYSFIGTVIALIPCMFFGRQNRSVVFHIDGRIGVPYGIPYIEDARWLPGQADLASIEAWRGHVALFFRSGHICTPNRKPDRFEFTHLATAQLNIALQEIKDARLALNEKRAPAPKPDVVQRVIQ